MVELFGFEIIRKKEKENYPSFAPPQNDDGSLTVSEGGIYGTYLDLDGSVRTEAELINKYRQISLDHTVDMAITDIVDEAIVEDAEDQTVSLNLDSIEVKENIKEKIQEEFKNVLGLLHFNSESYEIFKRWYIDGRLYYHVIIDEDKPRDGIKELRYIDPRHIKKIKQVKKDLTKQNVPITQVTDEYYVYNPAGFAKKSGGYSTLATPNVEGVKISKDSIVFSSSGLLSKEGDMILSYLHKALKPLNQLKAMEDSLVIYRISRAPERRIFYIDVGGLPNVKAEQYLRTIMNKFKNKVVYNAQTGEIRDDRKFMTMLEDFWLPRREGGRGTEITTLPGGQNLGEIEDIQYFQNNLYMSLNVPITRLQPENAFTLGRATEVSRDEVKFAKFIRRLRARFSSLFKKTLRIQLIAKGIITDEDFDEWEDLIEFDFAKDNYFEELKNIEVMTDRLRLATDMGFSEHFEQYWSHEFIRKNILKQTEEEMKDLDKQIKSEEKDKRYNTDDDMDGVPGDDSNAQGQGEQGPQPNKAVPGLNLHVTTDQQQPEKKSSVSQKTTVKKTTTA